MSDVDEPIRHVRFDARSAARMRRLTPQQRLDLGLGLTYTAMELAKKGGRTLRRPTRRSFS